MLRFFTVFLMFFILTACSDSSKNIVTDEKNPVSSDVDYSKVADKDNTAIYDKESNPDEDRHTSDEDNQAAVENSRNSDEDNYTEVEDSRTSDEDNHTSDEDSPVTNPNGIDLSGRGYWKTTYDCDDWISGTNNIECDGFSGGLTCSEDYGGPCACEEINAAANYPDGGGGKGQLHPACTGTASSGGGTSLYFDRGQKELWIRFYIKYEKGFKFENDLASNKILYLYNDQGDVLGDSQVIPKWQYQDTFLFAQQGVGEAKNRIDNRGWATTMGGATSDGKWHYIEIHIKGDTNNANGIGELWIDDLPMMGLYNINYDFADGDKWWRMTVGSNFHNVENGPWNVFYDDIAIATPKYDGFVTDSEGNIRIGPIGNNSGEILSWDVENSPVGILNNGTPNHPFDDINKYDGGNSYISNTLAHSGSNSVRIDYPNDEAGVSPTIYFPSTQTLFTRKYEYYDSAWAGNWPVGLKTSKKL